jgi:hypothetical protein
MLALWMFLALQDQTVRVEFDVENLLPCNETPFQVKLDEIDGVDEVSVSKGKVKLSIKPLSKAKLSEFLKALKGVKPFGDEKISLKVDGIKLSGKVVLSFCVEKNKDRIEGGLKGLGPIEAVERKGDDYHVAVKPEGITLSDLSSAIAKATEESTGSTTTLVSKVIKDVAWLGGPKPTASKEEPKPSTPGAGIKESPGQRSGG